MFDLNKLIADLKSPDNENYRQKIYDDKAPNEVVGPGYTIKGNLTIGIGWNVVGMLLSEEQHETICGWIVTQIQSELSLSWLDDLDEPRSRAFMNMAFNLGAPKTLGFKNLLSALENKDWATAKAEVLNSFWARIQSPDRAKKIAEVFLTGKDAE